MAVDPEFAWVEGYCTALDEVRAVVNELRDRANSCVRGGKANYYLAELVRRWPIPDDPTRRAPLHALDEWVIKEV